MVTYLRRPVCGEPGLEEWRQGGQGTGGWAAGKRRPAPQHPVPACTPGTMSLACAAPCVQLQAEAGGRGELSRTLASDRHARSGEAPGHLRSGSPLRLAAIVAQREQLLVHLFPALQAAPQPVGTHHVRSSALLGLAHLLRACDGTAALSSMHCCGWDPVPTV